MLLTLIKRRQTRYFWHAELIEKNPPSGDKRLAKVYIPLDEIPLELIYPVSVPRSGIWIQGRPTNWLWPKRRTKTLVTKYLQRIQATREEIRLEVTKPRPKFRDEK